MIKIFPASGTRTRCLHEFCCNPAVGDYRPVVGLDGQTRVFGLCAQHREPATSSISTPTYRDQQCLVCGALGACNRCWNCGTVHREVPIERGDW